jgi:hypothetical protein
MVKEYEWIISEKALPVKYSWKLNLFYSLGPPA